MVNETTITKLNELRLPSMADSYRRQLEDPTFNDLSFEERFALWWIRNGLEEKTIN